MNSVIAWLANYLLFVMAAVAFVAWTLREGWRTKAVSALVVVAGLVIAFVVVMIAARLHADPRPFVQNPSLHPLIRHSADNGFPSDHSVAAALLAAIVIVWHRLLGTILALAAVVIAAARVAAHVHHLQDVLAGLAIGVFAAWIATLLINGFLDWSDTRSRNNGQETSPAAQ